MGLILLGLFFFSTAQFALAQEDDSAESSKKKKKKVKKKKRNKKKKKKKKKKRKHRAKRNARKSGDVRKTSDDADVSDEVESKSAQREQEGDAAVKGQPDMVLEDDDIDPAPDPSEAEPAPNKTEAVDIASDDAVSDSKEDDAGGDAPRRNLPYAQRGIVLPKGMLRVDAAPVDYGLLSGGRGLIISTPPYGMLAARAGKPITGLGGVVLAEAPPIANDDVGVFLGVGAGYGITDHLEAGLVLLPIYFAPQADFGDIELYGRYRFIKQDKLEVGGQVGFVIPTNTDFGIFAGVPVRLLLDDAKRLRLDTGLQFRFTFADETIIGMDLPLAVNYNITSTLFVGGRLGFNWPILKESSTIQIPLGVQGGVQLLDGLMDVQAWFMFPAFISPGGDQKVVAKVWQIGTGATFWFDLGS